MCFYLNCTKINHILIAKISHSEGQILGLVRGEGAYNSNSPSSNASSKCSDAGNGNRADHSESSFGL